MICRICEKECKNAIGLTSHINQKHNISSKQYYDKYINKCSEGICKICKNTTSFLNIRDGYRKYCSAKCAKNDSENKEKTKQTCLKKYGVEYVSQCKEIRDKQKETCFKNYGVYYPQQNKEIQQKNKNTCLEKYGVDNVFKAEKIKKKINQTCIDKFGVYNIARTKKWKEYMKNGGAAYMNSFNFTEEIREKNRQYMLNGGASHARSFITIPSKPQIELYNIIKQLYLDAKLEYPILNFNVDIVIPSKKIAIEYDGSYWHQNKNYDKQRQEKIEKEGLKFLRYIDEVPTLNKIKNDLEKLADTK